MAVKNNQNSSIGNLVKLNFRQILEQKSQFISGLEISDEYNDFPAMGGHLK